MPTPAATAYRLTVDSDVTPQLEHGLGLLTAALEEEGLDVAVDGARAGEILSRPGPGQVRIVVGRRDACAAIARWEEQEVLLYNTGAPGEGGFHLSVLPGRIVVVTGADDNGVLYGCQELARIVRESGEVPWDLDRGETPDLAIRGPAIGLQKTTVEAPRQVYEYPITPDRFAWFYDRDLWLEVLETLLEQRANAIYLWSGHPFASFVRLPDYPEAQEVTDEELALNRETLGWLLIEAERRGIRVFLKFYNIHIPLPFARHHDIPLHQPKPTPLVSDYTRAALAAFVRDFPQIGLYVCLGEVLQGDLYGTEWFMDTILPGIEEGVAAAGSDDPPPIMLRAHSLDLKPVMDAAEGRYPRLYTEAKYNGESLTTWNPRGGWQRTHRYLASLGGVHVVNVHILSDLEPFRYGAVSFIQRSVLAIRHRLDSDGLHLYPLFYWEWPISPDKTEPRLRQLDRDWIWFAAWHRYAWKADRDPRAERDYWAAQLGQQFGSEPAGRAALEAYEAMGQVAPRLLRRLGITEGNRQTFALGMTMSQLTNPSRHRAFTDLWESHAPNGERLEEYVAREAAGEEHLGETPVDVIEEAVHFARRALEALERGADAVTTQAEEYGRLRTDAQAIAEIAQIYALRVRAAIEILRYREDPDGDGSSRIGHLREAARLMAESVECYRDLADLTDRTYHYANSMQTPQRKVPFPDGKAYGHWRQCLPMYEAELANVRAHIATLERGERPRALAERDADPEPFTEADFRLLSAHAETFQVGAGAALFTDADSPVLSVAPEIDGLCGVRLSRSAAFEGEVPVELELPAEAHVLVGYLNERHPRWLQVPDLETNTHADDRGGLTPVLRHALTVELHPTVNVHAFRYEAGRHTLALGPGAYVILGVVSASEEFTGRDVAPAGVEHDNLDWLYENGGLHR